MFGAVFRMNGRFVSMSLKRCTGYCRGARFGMSETIKCRLYFVLFLLLYISLVAWFKHFNCITANKENCCHYFWG